MVTACFEWGDYDYECDCDYDCDCEGIDDFEILLINLMSLITLK